MEKPLALGWCFQSVAGVLKNGSFLDDLPYKEQ